MMKVIRKTVLAALAALGILICSGLAQATTIVFGGTVTGAGGSGSDLFVGADLVHAHFANGTTYSVTVTFDSSIPDTWPGPTGEFNNAITSIFGSFSNGYTFTGGSGYIDTDNRGFDRIQFHGFNLSGASVEGMALDQLRFYLVDNTGVAFSSDSLASLPSTLTAALFDTRGFELSFKSAAHFGSVAASIDSVAIATTPIPASLPLLISALALLPALKRRRKNQVGPMWPTVDQRIP